MNNRVTITFSRNFVAGDTISVYYSDPTTQTSGYWTFTWVNGTAGTFQVQIGTPTTTTGEIEAIRFASSWSNSLNGFTVTQPVGGNDNQVQITSQTYHFVNVLAKFADGSTMAIPTDYSYVLSTVSTGNKITYEDKLPLNTPTADSKYLWKSVNANEVKTKHNLNDDRIGTLETDKADLVGGNNFTGDQTIDGNIYTKELVIDPLETTTGIASSISTVKNESTVTSTNVTEFIDVNRNNTTSDATTAESFSQVVRIESNSTFEDKTVAGSNIVCRKLGSGKIVGQYAIFSNAEYNGTGDVDFLTSEKSEANVIGTGSGTVNYLRGVSTIARAKNSNAQVNHAQGGHFSVGIGSDSTVGKVEIMVLDIDTLDTLGGTVTNELSYLKIINDDFTNITINGEAYAILSYSTLKSYLEGSLGVGTSTPSEKLEVAGNIKSSGDVILVENSRVKLDVDVDDNSYILHDGTNVYASANDHKFIQGSNGNYAEVHTGNLYEHFTITNISISRDLSNDSKFLLCNSSSNIALTIPSGLDSNPQEWKIVNASSSNTVTVQVPSGVTLNYINNDGNDNVISASKSATLVRYEEDGYYLIKN